MRLNCGRNILKKMTELSIVIPVFNEEKNVWIVAEKFNEMEKKGNFELIFVEDGGSTDGTREELKRISKKFKSISYLFINERGYGTSIYGGLKRAKGEFLCWSHADLQTDIFDATKALQLAKKEKNQERIFVKGKRVGRHFFDKFFEFGMSIFETALLGEILYDINAQPNLFHKSFLKNMKNPPLDFSFDLYSYYLAKRNGLKIVRFPVLFPMRIYGKSKWNAGDFGSKYRFIKRTIKFTFKLKKNLRNYFS